MLIDEKLFSLYINVLFKIGTTEMCFKNTSTIHFRKLNRPVRKNTGST